MKFFPTRRNLFPVLGAAIISLSAVLAITVSAFTGPADTPGIGQGAIASDALNNLAIGTSTEPTTRLRLMTTPPTGPNDYVFKIMRPDGMPIFYVRNDGKISISTSTASSTVTIGGTIYADNLLGDVFTGTISAANVTPGVFNGSTTGNYAFNSSLGIATSSQASLPAALTVYATSAFLGNIGINTASPAALLDIRGIANTSHLILREASSQSPSVPYIRFLDSAGVEQGRLHVPSPENVFFGRNSGIQLTTGLENTAMGFDSGGYIRDGSKNTAFGAHSLQLNNGQRNTAVGHDSLYSNTTGNNNVALGDWTGFYNATGSGNVFLGRGAGYNELGSNKLYIANDPSSALIYGDFTAGKIGINTSSSQATLDVKGLANTSHLILRAHSGQTNANPFIKLLKSDGTELARINIHDAGLTPNIFIGKESGAANVDGGENVAIGGHTLWSNTLGSDNTAIGESTLRYNTSGRSNTGIGSHALFENTTGNGNVAVGGSALSENVDGGSNVAVGHGALASMTGGARNTIIGYESMLGYTNSSENTALGAHSGFMGSGSTATGGFNTFVGTWAGFQNMTSGVSTSSRNVFIGFSAGSQGNNQAAGNGNVFIGHLAGFNDNRSDKLYIANNTSTALIYGDFSAGRLGVGSINGPLPPTPAATLHVISTSAPTIRVGNSGLSGCVELGNSDGSPGINYITALNGTLTVSTTKPPQCQ